MYCYRLSYIVKQYAHCRTGNQGEKDIYDNAYDGNSCNDRITLLFLNMHCNVLK